MRLETSAGSSRNGSLDILKLIASFLVVFIHIPFPAPAGRIVACVARSAVPCFFAISGFFSYGVDSGRLGRRMKYMLRLLVWGYILVILGTVIQIRIQDPGMGRDFGRILSVLLSLCPSWKGIAEWFLLDRAPVNGALWYLTAAWKCYAVLWCYVRFFGDRKPDYRMFYLAGVLLFAIYLVLGVMQKAAGGAGDLTLLRNALLLGLPMFAMGLFLGQYWKRIWIHFQLTGGKLLALLVLGMALSLFEQETVQISDAHIGSVLAVLACLLLLAEHPGLLCSPRHAALARKCADWSVGIYLVHIPLNQILSGLLEEMPWAGPVLAAGLSLALAMLNSALYQGLKNTVRKR